MYNTEISYDASCKEATCPGSIETDLNKRRVVLLHPLKHCRTPHCIVLEDTGSGMTQRDTPNTHNVSIRADQLMHVH